MSSHAVSCQNMVTPDKIISMLNKYYEVQESTDTNESVEKEISMLDDKIQKQPLIYKHNSEYSHPRFYASDNNSTRSEYSHEYYTKTFEYISLK